MRRLAAAHLPTNAYDQHGYFANGSGTFLTLGGFVQPNANGTPNIGTITPAASPASKRLPISLTHPANVSLTGWLPTRHHFQRAGVELAIPAAT